MERIIFGDNQFFAVNHISDEKAMQQSIRFRNNNAIIRTLEQSRAEGVETFMCTTHERIGEICAWMRANDNWRSYTIYPCMPYAHKYANSVTELGIAGTLRKYIPGNVFGSLFKGGMAMLSRDYISIMELLIDSEMKMFKGMNTPVIFLQNVVTDLLIGLQMKEVLAAFAQYVRSKYNAEPGFITMNLPFLVHTLEAAGVKDPIVCASINKVGFRMSGGKALYEKVLAERKVRVVAMQVLAGGAIPAKEAIEYVAALRGVDSILFGASSVQHIRETVEWIHRFDQQRVRVESTVLS
jgi:hypothetical protein